MDKRQMEEWIAFELRKHPWADDRIARRIVEDNLRDDVHFYDRALDRDMEEAEDDDLPLDEERAGRPEDDPYPEEDEEVDEDEEEEEERRRRGRKPKGGVLIVFGGKKSEDPYPED